MVKTCLKVIKVVDLGLCIFTTWSLGMFRSPIAWSCWVCRYPEDRVPPHTSSKLRQGAGRASTRCHISCSFRPHLPAEVGSDATTCPMALDIASLLRWAPALSHVPRLRTLPPWWGELRCCHVSCGPGPRLLAEVRSGATTCPSAQDLASFSRWAPVLPCVPQPRSSPPCWGELRCCHVSHSSGSCLLIEVSSGAATCPMAPGELWTTEIKKCLAALGSCVSRARSCVTEAPTRRAGRYSATL
jgi:hypothetical protein